MPALSTACAAWQLLRENICLVLTITGAGVVSLQTTDRLDTPIFNTSLHSPARYQRGGPGPSPHGDRGTIEIFLPGDNRTAELGRCKLHSATTVDNPVVLVKVLIIGGKYAGMAWRDVSAPLHSDFIRFRPKTR